MVEKIFVLPMTTRADISHNHEDRADNRRSGPDHRPPRQLRIPELLSSDPGGSGRTNSRIGVFDSGIGGLSVVRKMVQTRPRIPLVYIADQAHAPYGDRTLAEIERISIGITEELIRHRAEVIVLACNTASAAALYSLRGLFPDRIIVGMEPAVKPAAAGSKTGKIGILATALTFQGGPFAGVLTRFADRRIKVYTMDCPEFVRLVEEDDLHSSTARMIVTEKLTPLLDQGVDQIVLGCTHYSFLGPLIAECCRDRATVIDPAQAVADQALRMWRGRPAAAVSDPVPEPLRFITTDRSRQPFLASFVERHIAATPIRVETGEWESRPAEKHHEQES